MRVLVLSDNKVVMDAFREIAKSTDATYTYKTSDKIKWPKPASYINKNFHLVFSAHCRWIFPPDLVSKTRCINLHPGFNPYNRGWYPHVFSLINGLPAGVTIHEMDEKLDHGPIIAQKEVKMYSWDTSDTLYDRILEAEFSLLRLWLPVILNGSYKTWTPKKKGNLNTKKDYAKLCKLDLSEITNVGAVINKLRALSHELYQNAYFMDGNQKVLVSIFFGKTD